MTLRDESASAPPRGPDGRYTEPVIDLGAQRRRLMQREALRRVTLIESDYHIIRRRRHELWREASSVGCTRTEVADAAGVPPATVASAARS